MPSKKTLGSAGTEQHSTVETTAAKRPSLPNADHGPVRRVVVVGVPADVPRALEHPAVGRGKIDVAAVLAVDDDLDEREQGMGRLSELLDAHEADAILVAGPVGPITMRRVADLAALHGCELLAVMPTEMLSDHDPVIVWSGDSPLVQLSRISRRPRGVWAKRAIDILGASAGLIVTAPIIAVLAAWVRLDSKGSPIFRHERIGHGGRRFNCLKLRTMRADAEMYLRADPELYEEYKRNHFKIADERDPRVTALGRFLRRTSLDELPQLWNVLRGDMSLVGPRPIVEDELDVYGASKDLLLSMRPGLTGSWAVSGRHDVGYPHRCSIELEYVRRWSLAADARIVMRTVLVLIRSA